MHGLWTTQLLSEVLNEDLVNTLLFWKVGYRAGVTNGFLIPWHTYYWQQMLFLISLYKNGKMSITKRIFY